MTAVPVVFLDACVLAPMPLADTLLRLAGIGLYSPKWSAEVIEEMRRTLVGKLALTVKQALRRESAMRQHFPGAWVTGHEPLIELMPNDPADRHVLAAAIHCGAVTVVTANLRHFAAAALAPLGIVAQHPDEFLLRLHDRHTSATHASVAIQARSIGEPEEFVVSRLNDVAPRFVAAFRRSSSGSTA